MESLNKFKTKLAMLEVLLKKMDGSHVRVKELKRSVRVLRDLLRDPANIQNPYGPKMGTVRFSLQ